MIFFAGTMFDIIDLNETDHNTKPVAETTTNPQEKNLFKTIKKWIPKSEKTEKGLNEQKPKFLSKTVIYKNSDPKRTNLNPTTKDSVNKTQNPRKTQTTTENYLNSENENVDINKEFPLFPITKDASIFLNRTFRKQPPKIKKYELTDTDDLPVRDISNNVEDKTPDMQFENLSSKINILNVKGISKHEVITMTHDVMDIDPKIDILNNNVSTQNNESEIIEFVAPSEIGNKTFDSEIFTNQFLSKTFSGEKNIPNLTTASGKSNTTEEPLEKDQTNPEDQPRPNRQRQLTRPQRKTFYPYFFSRVLG